MMQPKDLAARFEAYSDWRRRLSSGISELHGWLSQQELADAHSDLAIQRLLERLHQDKLVVAFVAEFSRGKSELINAIFFADFGQRLLPSSAGRTTMCPTELLHDPSLPPSIRLLPIETRGRDATVAEFKSYADEWTTFPLDLASASRMSEALARVSEVKRVSAATARKYGLGGDGPEPRSIGGDADRTCDAPVEVLSMAAELGIAMIGVPEELGGVGTERSTVTNVLVAEALAHGDLGLAVACLAPAAVSNALVLWGDEHQQATEEDANSAGA